MKKPNSFVMVVTIVLAFSACGQGTPYAPSISQEQYIQWLAPDASLETPGKIATASGRDAGIALYDAKTLETDAAMVQQSDIELDEVGDEPDVRFCDWEEFNDLIMNGDFEYQPVESCGWCLRDSSEGELLVAPVCRAADHDSCSFYLEIEDEEVDAYLFQTIHPRPESEYELSFEAKSAVKGRPLLVYLPELGRLDDLARGIEFELEPVWRIYRHRFMTTDYPNSSELFFVISGSPVGFYLDNVSVIPMGSRTVR